MLTMRGREGQQGGRETRDNKEGEGQTRESVSIMSWSLVPAGVAPLIH